MYDSECLVICPVGMEVTYDPRWSVLDHWRWNHNPRDYETLVVTYNDFEPEPNSYDHKIKMKGHKWQIMRDMEYLFDLKKYKYVACVDDDLITDYQSFNEGLKLAKQFDFDLWQLSMPPDSDLHQSYHQCLLQDKSCTFSETTFIEMGSPFFKVERFLQLSKLLSYWDFEVGMGIDRVFCHFFGCNANVVHSKCIHQPKRESYYDKTKATAEMYDFMNHKYSEILKKHYNRECDFVDRLSVINKFKLGTL